MKWCEHSIARAIATQTLASRCVVLVDNCKWTGHECDVLGVTADLRIIDVEIKISRSDLRADARKDKWWHRQYGEWIASERRQEQILTPRTHPPKVWKHYYALPAEIWTPELADSLPSPASGVLLLREADRADIGLVRVSCWRRATPCRDAYRLTPEQTVGIARLANLRMWEAYQ